MWFKQASIYQLSKPVSMSSGSLAEALEPLCFTPCLPSLPASVGWVPPLEVQEGELVHNGNGFWMLCLQFEDKILPAGVIRQALNEKVATIQQEESRIVRSKEKQDLKAEITQTLLPRAFTKKSRVYGYIDTNRNWLVIDSNRPAAVERFTAFLKRAMTPNDLKGLETKKPSTEMTGWLKHDEMPTDFSLGQASVFQDPQQFRRMIRCQHQDLNAKSIQTILEEGCEVIQLALSWKDQVQFVLASDFSLRAIRFQDAVLALAKEDYTETAQQRFDTDFLIMTEVLTRLIADLHEAFSVKAAVAEPIAA